MAQPANENYFYKSLIGGVSCGIASALLNPFDVTKIRMQNQKGHNPNYSNIVAGCKTILREEGPRGLMRGLTPSMFREISYSSVRMGAYDPIRDALAHHLNDHEDPKFTSPLVKYFSALISGGVGAAFANPFDLIKTRFQAMLPSEPAPYKNMFDAFKVIYRAEGMAGLYIGWAVTCARAAVLTSAQIGTYDSVKNNLFIHVLDVKEGLALHLYSAMTASLVTVCVTNPRK